MEDEAKKVIVFAAYDTVMEANLAKTKLDAYGIPCFLTDEHLTQMYPFRNDLFPGVRLHIFEEDREQVSELLSEGITELATIRCPSCQSADVVRGEEDAFADWRQALAVYFFTKPRVRQYSCNHCGHRWN